MNVTPRFPEPTPRLDRRDFLRWSAASALGLLAAVPGCASSKSGKAGGASRIAFNTANLVARVSGYRFELSHWGEQHQKTVAATDEKAWRSICQDIAAAGFRAVEIWEAHAAPETMNESRARTWKRILDETGLRPIGYAGGLRRETLQICAWLGIPHVDGGLRGLTPAQATKLCRQFGIAFNSENHPEKSTQEILAVIGGGSEWLGVCVDTGWLGTQSVPVPEAIRTLGPLVRHTHIKDVKAAGKHETCLLGEGVVNVAGCLQALREIGYRGWYSWEDEPEDRNPFDSAARNRRWIAQHLRG
jgi:sugar phosphate isomerase/epimerase